MLSSVESNMTSTHELGITIGKTEDFGQWYQQIITKCELIDYYDISGCYVLLPNSYSIWEMIQRYLDDEFKLRGVKNVYFPLFITKRNLEMETAHIEGFSPEVAWVTKTGNSDLTQFKTNPDGSTTRDESNYIAVRPTSECAIYPIVANHIRSYMDVPLKYNQWCSVVRWEFKDATPFIRSREFLWQEGHTCHRTKESAMEEVNDILDLYQQCYREVLAIPTIRGYKTEKEKFSGADMTATIETYIPGANRAIQCATSHCLGQNFSKLFNITFKDENNKTQHVWQNSWGFTTRSIGVMIMTHGDNKGVVYPPHIAPIQIGIIPIIFKNSKDVVMNYIGEVMGVLKRDFRLHIDMSNHHAGWKQNYYEVMGAPIKLEIGPKDVENGSVRLVRRDTLEKIDIKFDDQIVSKINNIFGMIHEGMYNRALEQLNQSVVLIDTWDGFCKTVADQRLCLTAFCNETPCEEAIKEETGAKSLCIPKDKEYVVDIDGKSCVKCGKAAKTHCLFGRSY